MFDLALQQLAADNTRRDFSASSESVESFSPFDRFSGYVLETCRLQSRLFASLIGRLSFGD